MGEMIERAVLQKMCKTLSDTSIEILKAFFNKDFVVKMPWEVVDQLQCQFDLVLTMGASSKAFRAICCTGIQHDSLKAFSGMDEFSEKDTCDILGEFCNCYHGALCTKSEYADVFGTLEQAVPVLYTEGHSFLPFISGMQGYVYSGRHWLYIGYSICPKEDSRNDLS